jgi:hypothetical protein
VLLVLFGVYLGYEVFVVMKMFGKKKIKICDSTGAKIDVAIISNENDAKNVLDRWKKKGLF